MADSLRARTLINLSAVLYEQAAARTGLSAEVGNIDLNFVPGVAFIPDVYIADSLRARTLINLSAVLLRVGIMDLDFVPGVAFDAMGNVELTGDLLGDADRVNNNNNNERTASLAKQIKTDENCKKSTHCQGFNGGSSDDNDVQLVRDNIEELIYVGKVKNNRNNLNIMVTDPTSREFGRVDMKSLTRLCLLIDRAKADVADVFNTVISKSDEVPTRELSSYIKIELYLLRDNSRKFYRLVITSKNTHYKQIIKKVYIMSLERASLILFMT
ncbi:hypothetical protein HBI49_238020 [Parastagonospora nodorum]|nr:hypothetical protein HBI49_238020 [Parastagonospora nodorum]